MSGKKNDSSGVNPDFIDGFEKGCHTDACSCNTVYYDKKGFLCVIATPANAGEGFVELVSPYRGGEYNYSSDLCERTVYLPRGYLFSVEVYKDQFMHVKLQCVRGDCDCLHILDGVPTVLHPCRVAALMYKYKMYSSNDLFVLTGLCRGFRILDPGVDISYALKNYSSILEPAMYKQMCETISKELCSGQVTRLEEPAECVHALGAVVRPDGRLRPITDCSRPCISINDHMSTTALKFKFSHVEDTRSMVDLNWYGSVIDISNAYRSVMVYPPHRKYQGFSWELDGIKCNFQDNALCFGLRSAPSIFNQVSSFVTRLMVESGIACQGYLDDYLVTGQTWEECKNNQLYLVNLLKRLGFKINDKKVTEPSHSPKYLGVIVDMQSLKFRLPEEKLQKTSKVVQQLLHCSFCARKDLERATGLLAHCAVLVKGGRTFCRRLYSLLKATSGQKRVRLSDIYKMDLRWWESFLRIFDGTCDIFQNMTPAHHVFTDASGTGFGAWHLDQYLFGFWGDNNYSCPHLFPPPALDDISESNINVKELWPVVAAIKRWGHLWYNSQVLLHSDNTQVVTMVATGRSRNTQAMGLLREIFWCCAVLKIDLRASYISTNDNIRADNLSRLPKNVSRVRNYGLPLTFMSCCVHRPAEEPKESL